jgi:UDP-2-acetamido-2,6-beta-L-arabino-hexul-4-ose reductase
MRVLVTGIGGFIGRNLAVRLKERGYMDVTGLTRASSLGELEKGAGETDFVFHLAGVNRPQNEAEFTTGNVSLTEALCAALAKAGRRVPVVYSSSTQALVDNAYGRSKLAAEKVLFDYAETTGARVCILRLPNVFGKWSRPHYNSAVATFCHQVARGLPITINRREAPLNLIYVDDVVETFLGLLANPGTGGRIVGAGPVYETTVGALADAIQSFPQTRKSLTTDRVGTGLLRALHATYLSFLPPEQFAYDVPRYADPRGEFVEMLKTPDCGQLSYFTAPPGVTRGEHYHHSKTEKFLVVRGTARYQFRHIVTDERHEIVVRGGEGRIVETVPGWTHNITNVGDDELIVMLWANEIFDREKPDTFAQKVFA